MVGEHSFVSQYVYKGPARSPGIVAGMDHLVFYENDKKSYFVIIWGF
jgi:hypothetical protein